ncbi:MAG: RNA ligase family protein [bacterium]|nr:RNA ligase family protein [bacterium]
MEIFKYPRTHHIEGSRLQPGDEDLDQVPFSRIANRFIVVEEKMDGANCGVSFSSQGELMLQSRGHYLTGGAREKHFNLFKTWATTHQRELEELLQDRYIMYGEWLYAKHTIFYNRLPHFFMEFDIMNKETQEFLSTEKRMELLAPYPVIAPVKVLFEGKMQNVQALTALLEESFFIEGEHRMDLHQAAQDLDLDPERALNETDPSNLMEGLYIKVEEKGIVTERYKYVRAGFLTTVEQSESHWLNRPIIPNRLREGVSLW